MGEVLVLGPLEVHGEDGPVALPAAKHRRLLAALILARGEACATEQLVEAVWDGRPPATARKLVQLYVSQLRKLLPDGITIRTSAGGYALELAGAGLDAVRFERLARECADAARSENAALALSLAQRALALWRGRAYAEFVYDDFAQVESERLEELRLGVLEERLAAELVLGRHEEVVAEVLAAAARHPLRERLQSLAMLALYRCGRQSEALDLYRAARKHLREELGLEPGPALRELQQQILRQDARLEHSTARAAANSLPLPAGPLVGRTRELELLAALLERREARLVVLTGAGGSGKTRLALEAARQAEPGFANGAVLVELASLPEARLVLPTIAHALGLVDPPQAGLVDAIAEALRHREQLVVLDNLEHVRDAAADLPALLRRAPRLVVLATSRAVLHVTGEQVLPVAPLPEDDAAELFEARAQLLDPAFGRTADNEADIREICRRVDGLPLAVELAAARTRTLPLPALRERLEARLHVLTGGPRDLPARQQTLRDTIAWSVDLLTGAQRRVLAALAVFPAGATLDAAEAVCGADVDTLEALVDQSLAQRLRTTPEAHFGLLETVREYAYELLEAERTEVELAMAVYLAELVERAELKGPAQGAWLERLDAELDNLRAALAYAAAARRGDLEIRIAGRLWRYWWVRGWLAEGIARIEAALERSGPEPSRARAHALGGAAGLVWAAGDFAKAKRLGEEAIAVASRCGALHEESTAQTVLGVLAASERDWAAARRHHERSAELVEGLGLEPVTEKLNLGIVALDSGDLETAGRLFAELLARHREKGVVEGVGFASLNLGLVSMGRGDDAAAQGQFEEALAAFETLGFRSHAAHALQGLAAVAARAGRYEEAARLLGRAGSTLDEIGWLETDFDADLVRGAVAQARAALGEAVFDAAYAAGREQA